MVAVRLCPLLVIFLSSANGLPAKDRQDDGFDWKIYFANTATMITEQGYRAETHKVTTKDGYILGVHRIPHGFDEVPTGGSKPVVLLMHGFTSASHAYVGMGRNYSLGFNLADAGFDVWLGNARGNAFSRAHQTLNPDHEADRLQFFDFTWDEIGNIDLPAMIDYILHITGRNNLQYIGHSQGGTNFLVLTSMQTEYNAKISSAHLFAGVGYTDHHPDPISQELSKQTDFLYNIAVRIGLVEFSPIRPLSTRSQCQQDPDLEHLCNVLQHHPTYSSKVHTREYQKNSSIDSILGIGGTAGAAVKQLAHFGQNLGANLFRRWNYGSTGNLAAYGTEEAPLYNISRITVNTTMHYTISDHVLGERDVLNMVADMPHCVARKVARNSFLHDDFIEALDAKELVFHYVIKSMLDVENRINPVGNSASTSILSINLVLQISILVYSLSVLLF